MAQENFDCIVLQFYFSDAWCIYTRLWDGPKELEKGDIWSKHLTSSYTITTTEEYYSYETE